MFHVFLKLPHSTATTTTTYPLMKRHSFLILLVLVSLRYEIEAAFTWERKNHRFLTKTQLRESKITRQEIDITADIQNKVKKYFSISPDIQLLSFSLTNHKPLGCSAEECLKVEVDGMKHVFISSLVSQGSAEKAGLLVGDVLVGVSGSFSEIEDVFGMGLNRIRSLIAGRPAEQNLDLIIVRGTDIQSKHDTALIDLCILPEDNDVVMGNCIKALYDSSRDTLDENNIDENSIACDEKDTECMLDAMFRYWDEEEEAKEIQDKN